MRVLLTGPPAARARLRNGLVDAGIEIVAESAVPPDSATPHYIDAIVTATPRTGPGLKTRPPYDPASGSLAESRDVAAGRGEGLTPRELEVLALLAEGLPNKGIAHSLGISDQTVKFHVAAIIGKLSAANRTDAVRRAIRRGLVAI
ncbi:MAG TPA: response regulator transcription factor [Vicinamibacterales bacterium]|nr:response regulator transcription factor [Vicinamibacterales bacterium]